MNSPTPPLSLKKSAVKYPHRLATRNEGMSYLESSFARGNIEEIRYWIATGEVDKAMSGQTRYKKDYTKTLFTRLSAQIGRTFVGKQNHAEKLNSILEYLWERGADQHKHLYRNWMSNLVELPFADKLEELGVNPWDNGTATWQAQQGWTDEQIAEQEQFGSLSSGNHHWSSISPGRAAAEKLTGITHSCIRDSGYSQQQVIKRLNRYMSYPQASEEDLSRCLAMLVCIDMGGKSLLDEEQIVNLADRIIEKGAGAAMMYGDALYHLAGSAPSEELRFSEVVGQFRKREDAKLTKEEREQRYLYSYGLNEVIPTQEQAKEVAREMITERIKTWEHKSQKWQSKLLPLLDKDCPQAYRRDPKDQGLRTYAEGQMTVWLNLIQSPSGLEIAQKIRDAMEKRGQALPWHHEIDSQRSHHVRVFEGRGRHPYLLAQFVELLDDKSILATPTPDSWKVRFVKSYLSYSRNGNEKNRPRFDQVSGWPDDWAAHFQAKPAKRITINSWKQDEMRKFMSPTTEEMQSVLDFLGIEGQQWNPEANEKHKLMEEIVASLPRLWTAEEGRTSENQRQEVMDVLARRGILQNMLSVMDPVGLAERLGEEEKSNSDSVMMFRTQYSQSYERWAKHWLEPQWKQQLTLALERNGEHNEQDRDAIELIELWKALFGIYSLPEASEPVEFTQQVNDVLGKRPQALEAFGANIAYEAERLKSKRSWTCILSFLHAVGSTVELGWQIPQEKKDKIIKKVAECAGTMESRGEEEVKLLEMINSTGFSQQAFATKLMSSLLSYESERRQVIEGWSTIVELCSENRWEVEMPSVYLDSSQSLYTALKKANLKRQLKDVAISNGRADLNEALPSKPKLKM